MAQPQVTAVRGIELNVRDLAASAAFYSNVWGLTEVGRQNGSIHFRATGDEHHVLTLHAADNSGLASFNVAAADKGSVDGLHAAAIAYGANVLDAPHGLDGVAGGGYGFNLTTPDGIRLTVSCDVARHAARIDDRTRPNKFSHIVLRSEAPDTMDAFFIDLLGFRLSDKNGHIDFLRCSPDHHSVAIGHAKGPGLHHMAFELPDLDGLMSACGRAKVAGYPIEWGIGRHAGPGENVFCMFVEPNGFASEYTTEMYQCDEATYPKRSIEYWKSVPLQPCAWGLATQRSEMLHKARSGQLVEELNARHENLAPRKAA